MPATGFINPDFRNNLLLLPIRFPCCCRIVLIRFNSISISMMSQHHKFRQIAGMFIFVFESQYSETKNHINEKQKFSSFHSIGRMPRKQFFIL
jgi:hypothetical protein